MKIENLFGIIYLRCKMKYKTNNRKKEKSKNNYKKKTIKKKKSSPTRPKHSKKEVFKPAPGNFQQGKDDRLVDFHVHSRGSADGLHSIARLLYRAKTFNIDYMSITDHNNFNEVRRFLNEADADMRLAMHDFDGVNIVPGVEITCRVDDVKNLKGNDLKVHLLVYSPILTDDSPLVQLMKIKHGNDLAVDFGTLLNIAKIKGIQIDSEEVRKFVINERATSNPGFSSFGKEDVMNYFLSKHINIAKSQREYTRFFESIPRAERLNLSAEDVINIAHSSGGIVVMAHPKVHLNRTNNKQEAVDSLLEYGIDGFELMTPSMDNDTFTLITRECSRFKSGNPILYTGGSDFHVYSEHSKLGRFGDLPITAKSQQSVIKELNILNKVRQQDCITHRNYKMPLKSDLDATIDKYSQKAHEINEIYSEEQLSVHDIESSFSKAPMSYVDYLKELGIYDEGMGEK